MLQLGTISEETDPLKHMHIFVTAHTRTKQYMTAELSAKNCILLVIYQ